MKTAIKAKRIVGQRLDLILDQRSTLDERATK
jgi:hypothetical protein